MSREQQLINNAAKTALNQRYIGDILNEGIDKTYRINRGVLTETAYINLLWNTFGLNPAKEVGWKKKGNCIIAFSLQNALATHGQYGEVFRDPKDIIVIDEYGTEWWFTYSNTYFADVNSGKTPETLYGLNDGTEGWRNFDFYDVEISGSPVDNIKDAGIITGSWLRQPYEGIMDIDLKMYANKNKLFSNPSYPLDLEFDSIKVYVPKLSDTEDAKVISVSGATWDSITRTWSGVASDEIIIDFGSINACQWFAETHKTTGAITFEISGDDITYESYSNNNYPKALAVGNITNLYLKVLWGGAGTLEAVAVHHEAQFTPSNLVVYDTGDTTWKQLTVVSGTIVWVALSPQPPLLP